VSATEKPLKCGEAIHVSRVGDDSCICGKHRHALPTHPSADRLRAAFMAGCTAAKTRQGRWRSAEEEFELWLATQPQEPKPPAPFYQAGAEDVR
jgi:hypothetical protein